MIDINNIYNSKCNCLVLSKTNNFFSFKSFKTIQFILNQNKKLYKKIYYKKIPSLNKFLFIKSNDIIIEFIINFNIQDILNLLKYLNYKISFKFKVICLKK